MCWWITGSSSPSSNDLFFVAPREHPLLTKDEEIELSKRIEQGDLAAKERMVNSNMRLVLRAGANTFRGAPLPMADRVQYGAMGLMRAVEKFDWRRCAVLHLCHVLDRPHDAEGHR